MGMFDYISVDKRWLPDDLRNEKTDFQTKSLDNALFYYNISETGRLTYQDMVEQPKYTGEIRFYDRINGKWREFVAWCVHGLVKEVVEVNDENKL